MQITRTEYVKGMDTYTLDVEEAVGLINEDLLKGTDGNVPLVTPMLFIQALKGYNNKILNTMITFYAGTTREYNATLVDYIKDWYAEAIYEQDYDYEYLDTIQCDDDDITITEYADYMTFRRLPDFEEHIEMTVYDNDSYQREGFESMEEAGRYIYDHNIKKCHLQHYFNGIRYLERIENPDRYWFAANGVSYQELFDEDPEHEDVEDIEDEE